MSGSMSMPAHSTPGVSATDIDSGRTAAAKAATEFEAQFVSQMLTQMWQGIETDGYFGGGNGEEMFRGLMINEYGKQIAQSGQLGIADNVRNAMLKMQEV